MNTFPTLAEIVSPSPLRNAATHPFPFPTIPEEEVQWLGGGGGRDKHSHTANNPLPEGVCFYQRTPLAAPSRTC